MKEYSDMNILLSFVCMVCLLELLQHADAAAEITNMGVLVPVTGLSIDGRKVAAVLPVAVEAARKKFPNIQLNWSYVDTGCDEADSARAALEFSTHFSGDIDVFIGEVCSQACETVGFIATALHKPYISSGCNSDKLSRHDMYRTFSRSVPPFKSMVPAFSKLLEVFKWDRIGILTTDTPAYQLMSVAIKIYLSKRSPTVTAYITTVEQLTDNVTALESSAAKEVMDIVRTRSRSESQIYSVISEHIQMLDCQKKS